MRVCKQCGVPKPLEDFHAKGKSGRGDQQRRRHVCKLCANDTSRKWYRSKGTERRYNLSTVSYEQMLADQNGSCAICLKTPEENGKRLAIDHDHTCCAGSKSCGSCVRALLCTKCNMAIGAFNDDVNLLAAAHLYLAMWQGRKPLG